MLQHARTIKWQKVLATPKGNNKNLPICYKTAATLVIVLCPAPDTIRTRSISYGCCCLAVGWCHRRSFTPSNQLENCRISSCRGVLWSSLKTFVNIMSPVSYRACLNTKCGEGIKLSTLNFDSRELRGVWQLKTWKHRNQYYSEIPGCFQKRLFQKKLFFWSAKTYSSLPDVLCVHMLKLVR